jgi:hypothetical protein
MDTTAAAEARSLRQSAVVRDHLVVATDGQKRSILWWRVLASYSWSIAARELLRHRVVANEQGSGRLSRGCRD